MTINDMAYAVEKKRLEAPVGQILGDPSGAPARVDWRFLPADRSEPAVSPALRPLRAIAARCSGPGGYYNLGNALGLIAGIAFQFLAARDSDGSSVSSIAGEYLIGSPGATLRRGNLDESVASIWVRMPAGV